MTRNQFWILMGSAILLVVLLFVKGMLIQNTHELGIELVESQRVVMRGQAAKPLLNAITAQLLKGVGKEPDLSDLLRSYGLYPGEGIQ